MRIRSLVGKVLIAASLGLVGGASFAGEIRVAVASNFTGAINALAERFEVETGDKVILVFGSTGKQYAQIQHGAPFDIFFAADRRRPELLEQEGVAVTGSRFTYAVGKLVLWSAKDGYVDEEGRILAGGAFRHLAIANPKLAPYGQAAREVLRARGVWSKLQGRLVRGENIGQTFQFVKSGNAELGFVAYAQVKRPGFPVEGSYWEVPRALYAPIEQQAVLLRENAVARGFLAFVRGDEARAIIRDHGYDVP